MNSVNNMVTKTPSAVGKTGGVPLPYYDWGACPFEGCTYQAWEAVQPTIVWNQRDYQSAIAYEVEKGEWVDGITGVVITYEPGLAKALVPLTLGRNPSVSLVPGDFLLTLHYVGEGVELFWFNGKTYKDQITRRPESEIEVFSGPLTAWWVKVRNAKGQLGWTDQTAGFIHIDSLE